MAPVQFKDYYDVLGVDRNADTSTLRSAFRKKARELHPDVNSTNPDAEERFKEVNEAYEALSDPEKRRMYDRFGADWQRYRDAGVSPDDVRGSTRGGTTDDFETWFTGGDFGTSTTFGGQQGDGRFSDFFNLLFGNQSRGGARDWTRGTRPIRGNDADVAVTVSLREAAEGTNRQISMRIPEPCKTCGGDGIARGAMCPTCDGSGTTLRSKTIEVRIPKGVRTGSRVRIAGQGDPGIQGGPNGDIYLVVTVSPDARFERDGDNLRTTVRIPLYTALLGGEAIVPTLNGRVALTVPPETPNGKVFRLRGKGMPRLGSTTNETGDLLVRAEVELPTKFSDRERALLTQLRDLRQ